jgi:predicted dehydrogenase
MSEQENKQTRRGFLISSAAAAALAATAGMANAANAPATKSSTKPTSKPLTREERQARQAVKPIATTRSKYNQINVAFIGIEGQGGTNLRGMAEAGANVYALCDTDSLKLDRRKNDFPNAKYYTDFREMLDKEKNIDAVVVATPDHCHAPAAMMAMKLGKHVYCEKPMTHDIHEARVLTAAARKYGVKTQMGNQGAATEAARRQVEYIRSGLLGRVKEVHFYTDRPIWPQGLSRPTKEATPPPNINWDVWLGPAPYHPYHVGDDGKSVYHDFKWRGWWDFGTGALGDMACHIMNTSFWGLNLTNPASVEAIYSDKTDVQAPNWSVIKYEFPKLGQREAVSCFWYDGKMLPPYSLLQGKRFPGQAADNWGSPNGTIIVGEKGTLICPYMEAPYFANDQQQKEHKPPDKFVPRSIGHREEWLESILGGRDGASAFDHSGPLTEMVLLGNLAVRTGRKVDWDYKNAKARNDFEAQKYVKREYRKGWEL